MEVLAGSDMTVLETTFDRIDVTGIGGFTKQNVPIVTGASYIETTTGPIIGVFHQYAQFQGQKSIHSANQLRHMGNHVGDTPKLYGGTQSVRTSCGRIIPLSIRGGLPYMDMRTPTEEELESLPRVTMTSDMPWRPEDIDNEHAVSDLENPDEETPDFGYGEVNETGEIMKSVQFVDEEELPDLIPNPSTWYVKKPCPHHGQESKKVAPCQRRSIPTHYGEKFWNLSRSLSQTC